MVDQIRELSKKYNFREISDKLNIPYHKVHYIASKNNITSYYTKNIELVANNIKKLHSKGLTYMEISKKLGLSRTCVSDWYRDNKIELDGPGSGAHYRRKVKHNPFEDLNDPEVMYWLGFIASDGNLSSSNYSITLYQCVGRIDVLKSYVEFLKGDDVNIFINSNENENQQDMGSVIFSNKDVYEYLISMGITPKKSKKLFLKFPITWDFMRGYFDGDGSAMYSSERKSYKIKITCSSDYMIKIICNFFDDNGIVYSITFKDKNKKDQRDINILTESRYRFYIGMYGRDYKFCVKDKRGVIEKSINENSVNCLGTPEEGNQQPSLSEMIKRFND